MSQPRILRIPRSDDESAYILVQVTSGGSKPLDLRLIATEGEAPYVATLKNDRVASLRVKNCPASEKEWQAILTSLLGQEHLSDIQATATVQGAAAIVITIRKQIQGITQRLGSISLSHDADEGIELFEWCGLAAEAAAANREALASAAIKSQKSNDLIEELRSQLDELVQAKQEDEAALLQKFRDLLNEKKVKIREQQKLLATTSFNQDNQAEPPLSQSSPPENKRKPGKSRPAKRKAKTTTVEEYSDEEGIERMEVDEVKSEPQDTDSGRETEATASDLSDDDANEDEENDARAVAGAGRGKNAQSTQDAPKKKTEQPPPRRELPFANRKPASAVAKPTPAAAAPGSETESDDEL